MQRLEGLTDASTNAKTDPFHLVRILIYFYSVPTYMVLGSNICKEKDYELNNC